MTEAMPHEMSAEASDGDRHEAGEEPARSMMDPRMPRGDRVSRRLGSALRHRARLCQRLRRLRFVRRYHR